MRNKVKVASVGVVALAVCGLASSLAMARTLPATAGRPSTGASTSCFIWDATPVGAGGNIGLRNNCAAAPNWNLGLTIDNAVAHTVIVRAKETGAGSVSCSVVVVDTAGTSVGSDTEGTANIAGWQNLILLAPAVPPGGNIYVTCSISGPNTAKILSVDWF